MFHQGHLWPRRGWCGALSPAGFWPCSGNLPRPTLTHSQYVGSCCSAGRIYAWQGVHWPFWSKQFQGWVCIERATDWWSCPRTVQHSGREVMAGTLTHSPSAMHSISSMCPLNTVLRLEVPVGIRKVGLLSSTGASTVTHTQSKNRKELPSPLHQSL